MASFIFCLAPVVRVPPAIPAGRPVLATGPPINGGARGGGVTQPGLAVLAQEIVVLFGLNVQNHPAVEHNIRKLQHLLYIKRGIRTKKALSV